MNSALRFFVVAFLLALCYHWLGEAEWSDIEEDIEESDDDLVYKISENLKKKNNDESVQREKVKMKPLLEELQARQFVIEEIRQACLPRLVCELFAMEDKTTLSETERSLMTLISQTSLGTRATSSSQYHFAAHMGQLLVGIDGNGCQNFYPSCPIAGNQALLLARKMKIR